MHPCYIFNILSERRLCDNQNIFECFFKIFELKGKYTKGKVDGYLYTQCIMWIKHEAPILYNKDFSHNSLDFQFLKFYKKLFSRSKISVGYFSTLKDKILKKLSNLIAKLQKNDNEKLERILKSFERSRSKGNSVNFL